MLRDALAVLTLLLVAATMDAQGISTFPYEPSTSGIASDFESNAGSGPTAAGSAFDHGDVVEPRVSNGAAAWANLPSEDYSYDSLTWLRSPRFNFTYASGLELRYELWIQTRTSSEEEDQTDAGLKMQVSTDGGSTWSDVTTCSLAYNGSFSGLTTFGGGGSCWKGTSLGGANTNPCRLDLNPWAGQSDVRFRWCFRCVSDSDSVVTAPGPVLDGFRVLPVVASVGYANGYAAVPQGAGEVAYVSKSGGSPFTSGMTVSFGGTGVAGTVTSVTDDDNCEVYFTAARTADVGGQAFYIYDGTTRVCEGIVDVYYPQQLVPARASGSLQEPPQGAAMGANGVYLHNGEFRHDLPLLAIPGRMLPLSVGITYRSQLETIGALGAGWTASFDRRLYYWPISDTITLHSGNGRIDTFALASGGTQGVGPYTCAGYFVVIERDDNQTSGTVTDDVFTIIYTHGSTSRFIATCYDVSGTMTFRESEFKDRNNNKLLSYYNGSGQLVEMRGDLYHSSEPTRHRLLFSYNSHGRLASITDYADYTAQSAVIGSTFTEARVWEFQYNTDAQLVEIRLPQTERYHSDTKGASYRSRVQFTYDSNDNLLEVIDARQANESTPLGWLKNHYDTNDRVEFQDVGRSSASDTTHRQSIFWGTPSSGQHTVDVINAEGHRSAYLVQVGSSGAPIGTLQRVRHYTGQWSSPTNQTAAKIRSTDPDYLQTEFEYDSQYNTTRVVYPRGNESILAYDTGNSSQRSRGNLLRALQKRGALGTTGMENSTDQHNGLLARFTYSTDYNLPVTSVGPRAFELKTSYDIITNDSGGYERDDASDFATTNSYDSAGNLLYTQTAAVNASYSPGTLNSGQYLRTDFTYNSNGQVLTATDAMGVITRFEYGTSGFERGYLLRVHAGDQTSSPLTTEFGYNSVGRVITVKDPRGSTFTSFINQLDQVVRAETPAISTAGNAKYYTITEYDLNGNVEASKVSNIDHTGTAQSPTTINSTFTYNLMDMVTAANWPLTPTTTATTTFEYDKLYRPVLTTLPEGNQTATDYDELNRAIKFYAGFNTTNVVKSSALIQSEAFYDANGNTVKVVDGRGNHSLTHYDAYDRPYRMQDRLASNPNETVLVYNQSGQVVRATRKGLKITHQNINGTDTYSSGNGAVLAESETDYDNIGRAYRSRVMAKKQDGNSLGSGGYNTSRVKFRNNGQVQETLDNFDIPTRYIHDAYNRVIRILDDRDGTGDDDNEDEFTYDANGNITAITARLYDDADTSTGPHKVLTTLFWYDELNRLIKDRAPTVAAGAYEREFFYDSRSNLVRTIDRAGVTRSTEYDLAGRPVRSKIHDVTRRTISNLSYTVDVASRTEFDKNSNVVQTIDPNGNRAYHRHDLAGRWLQTQHADGGSSTPNKSTAGSGHTIYPVGSTNFYSKSGAYDGNSNMLAMTDANGTVTSWTYDENDIPLTESGDWSGASSSFGITGETGRAFEYDGLYRAWRGRTMDGTNATTESNRIFNTLGRIEHERQVVFGAYPGFPSFEHGGSVNSVYDAMGRRTQRKLRDSDVVTSWAFDRKHRPVTTTLTRDNISTVIAEYEYLGGGLLHSRQTKYHPSNTAHKIVSKFTRDNLLRVTSVRHWRDDSADSMDERLFGRYDYAYNANSMMMYEARWYETDANSSTPDEVDFYGFESDNRLYKAVYNASGINLSTVNYQDVLDDNQVTHSDRVFYERRRAGTRSQVHWWRGAADRDAAPPSSAMPDDTTTPDQTTGYATSDNPSAGPDAPAADGQGSRHNYTVIGDVGHTYDNNRNLLADGTREFRYSYHNMLRKVWRKSDGATDGLLAQYREDAFGRQVYAERHWELGSRYYFDTRFEFDVKVDVDNDGAGMVLIDGGMRGTTNPTFASAIQEATWPSKLKKPPHDNEAHYIDFLVDVPSASGTTYLGYLSYGISAVTYELRIFADRVELWQRGESTATATYSMTTAGRHNVGLRFGLDSGIWWNGTRILNNGVSPLVNATIGFGSKAVSNGSGGYTPGLALYENLNYMRAWTRTQAYDEENGGCSGPVVSIRTFDRPQPTVFDDVCLDDNAPVMLETKTQAGDSTQMIVHNADGDVMRTYLPNGRRQTALVIEDAADAWHWNGGNNPGRVAVEGDPLPGVARHVNFDATGTPTAHLRAPEDADTPDTYGSDAEELPDGGLTEFICITAEHGSHATVPTTEPGGPSAQPMATVPASEGTSIEAVGAASLSDDGAEVCACRENDASEPIGVAVLEVTLGCSTNWCLGDVSDRTVGIDFCGDSVSSFLWDLLGWTNPTIRAIKVQNAVCNNADKIVKVGDAIQQAKEKWSSIAARVANGQATEADWNELYQVASASGHTILDIMGLLPLPAISTLADLANASWYLAEGNYLEASLSAIGAIPVIGDAVTVAWKSVKAAVILAGSVAAATKILSDFGQHLRGLAKAGGASAGDLAKIDNFVKEAETFVAKAGGKGSASAAKNGKDLVEDLQKAGIIGDLKGTRGSETDGHHLLPKAFKAQFEAIEGIGNIDAYRAILDAAFHRKGCHGGKDLFGPGGKWNAEWKAWFELYSRRGVAPTKDEVMNKLGEMLRTFEAVDY